MGAFANASDDEAAKVFTMLVKKSKLDEEELFESYFVEAARAAL